MAYPRQYSEELDAKISVLYQTGHSTYVIASKLNLDSSFVQRSLIRTKTPRRDRKMAWELRRARG